MSFKKDSPSAESFSTGCAIVLIICILAILNFIVAVVLSLPLGLFFEQRVAAKYAYVILFIAELVLSALSYLVDYCKTRKERRKDVSKDYVRNLKK